jgi:hypothetical protein
LKEHRWLRVATDNICKTYAIVITKRRQGSPLSLQSKMDGSLDSFGDIWVLIGAAKNFMVDRRDSKSSASQCLWWLARRARDGFSHSGIDHHNYYCPFVMKGILYVALLSRNVNLVSRPRRTAGRFWPRCLVTPVTPTNSVCRVSTFDSKTIQFDINTIQFLFITRTDR